MITKTLLKTDKPTDIVVFGSTIPIDVITTHYDVSHFKIEPFTEASITFMNDLNTLKLKTASVICAMTYFDFFIYKDYLEYMGQPIFIRNFLGEVYLQVLTKKDGVPLAIPEEGVVTQEYGEDAYANVKISGYYTFYSNIINFNKRNIK